jgi:hypothetical protein
MTITNKIYGKGRETVEKLVRQVLIEKYKSSTITIDDFDLDRVYLTIDGEEYTIRTWDIREKPHIVAIRWTLFKSVGDHSDELSSGESKFYVNN